LSDKIFLSTSTGSAASFVLVEWFPLTVSTASAASTGSVSGFLVKKIFLSLASTGSAASFVLVEWLPLTVSTTSTGSVSGFLVEKYSL